MGPSCPNRSWSLEDCLLTFCQIFAALITMQSASYTSQNIARALGLDGFENDDRLAVSRQALRLLLLPSFHPELCVSFTRSGADVELSVVAAKEQIWHQAGPSPKATTTCVAIAPVTSAQLDVLAALARNAAAAPAQAVVVIDGMTVHTVMRVDQQCELDLKTNVGKRSAYAEFVAQALKLAWNAVTDARVKNALRAAGSYVGLVLQEQALPPEKPTIRTVVLGTEEEAAQLLRALKRKHEL